MKAGDKYIIEIGEVLTKKDGKEIGVVKGFKGFTMDEYGVSRLTPTSGTWKEGYYEGYKAGENDNKRRTGAEVYPLMTEEACIKFLQDSGWMAKHDKALTEGESSKSLRSYAQGFKDGFTHAKEIDEEAMEEFKSDENFDLGYAAGSKATELVSEAYYEKGKLEGEREGYNKGYKTGYEEGLKMPKIKIGETLISPVDVASEYPTDFIEIRQG